MHQINWFEERARMLVLSACEALKIAKAERGSREIIPHLRQNLVEAIRLYQLSTKSNARPTIRQWMNGDSEQEIRQAIKEAQKLTEKPECVLSWLGEVADRLGIKPPEVWRNTNTACDR